MPETTGGPLATRPGRCANHPGVARVGVCAACGRALCRACATPVRGSIIGAECLAGLLDEPAATFSAPPPVPVRGDRVAGLGFSLAAAATILPWSRFGDSSRWLGAWTVHWSLAAALASAIGLAITLFFWRRPFDQVLEALALGGLGLVVAGAAALHHQHPPPLSVGTPVVWLAVAGGVLAVAGAALKARAILSVTRPRR